MDSLRSYRNLGVKQIQEADLKHDRRETDISCWLPWECFKTDFLSCLEFSCLCLDSIVSQSTNKFSYQHNLE